MRFTLGSPSTGSRSISQIPISSVSSMRFDARRHWTHPVLRQGHDDFPDGDLSVQVSQEGESLSIRFQVQEPVVCEAIETGKARCAATIYCRETFFRHTEVAPPTRYDISWRLPVEDLAGPFDVSPFIYWDTDNTAWSSAHRDYGRVPTLAPRFGPLAVDPVWHQRIDRDPPPGLVSIFRLKTDPRIEDGVFDVEIDPGRDFITVAMNEATRLGFEAEIRPDPMILNSGVLLGVLVETLQSMRDALLEDPQAELEWPPDGWARCVKRRLGHLDLEESVAARSGRTLVYTAQKLLKRPLAGLILHGADSQGVTNVVENGE